MNDRGIIGTAIGTACIVAAGVCGLAATMYALVVAYVAGSEAQAAIDGCAPADPSVLAQVSMSQLASAAYTEGANASTGGVIDIDDADVSVS